MNTYSQEYIHNNIMYLSTYTINNVLDYLAYNKEKNCGSLQPQLLEKRGILTVLIVKIAPTSTNNLEVTE